jgi:hypothetical protein
MNHKTAVELVKLYEEHERIKALRDKVRRGSVVVDVNITSSDTGRDCGSTLYGFVERATEGGETANIARAVRRSVVENMTDQLNDLKSKINALGGDGP